MAVFKTELIIATATTLMDVMLRQYRGRGMIEKKEFVGVNRHHKLIQSLTGDNDEQVLRFFITFSRFEYAMKQAGFVKADRYYNALPDWQRFAKERLEVNIASIQDTEFTEARDFLLDAPPQKQIVVESSKRIQWRNNTQGSTEGEAEYVLRLVRDVRNNLFHGGKYPDGNVSGQALRNRRLLRSCVNILETCLSLDDDVKHYFEFLHDE